jgi:hypothetical protein
MGSSITFCFLDKKTILATQISGPLYARCFQQTLLQRAWSQPLILNFNKSDKIHWLNTIKELSRLPRNLVF